MAVGGSRMIRGLFSRRKKNNCVTQKKRFCFLDFSRLEVSNMGKWSDYCKDRKHCRWCGKQYKAHIPKDRDGFCGPTCKQAHYRAYKAYVTRKKTSDQSHGSLATKMSNTKKEGKRGN